ncbi:MAG: hypothetical protein K6E10_12375 [Eubacterium sp.]|nr:hypothetical protein [Eubacterium sp.]
MIMNIDSITQELDRLYQFEISEYIARCDQLKKSGFKIYRNSAGQHKVVLANAQARKSQEQQYVYDENQGKRDNAFTRAKKDNIFIRAKNRIVKGYNSFRSVIGFIKYLYSTYSKNQ